MTARSWFGTSTVAQFELSQFVRVLILSIYFGLGGMELHASPPTAKNVLCSHLSRGHVVPQDWDVQIKTKDNSPLTKADLAANKVICDALTESYPDIPM